MIVPSAASTRSTGHVAHSAARIADRCRLLVPDDVKKEHGQYFTSAAISAFMSALVEAPQGRRTVRILDPGAGTGMLGIGLAERLVERGHKVHLVAVERERQAATHLEETLQLARATLGERFSFELLRADFLDMATPLLGTLPLAPCDIAIGNPPYFKVSPNELRGGDAPNVYARFMEVASQLLVPDGQMCFIIPRSFASGLYFRQFRRRFHRAMRLDRVHVFGSRRAAFKTDGVLQENIIVHYRKAEDDGGSVVVSSSAGEDDLDRAAAHSVPRRQILSASAHDAVLFLPLDADDLRVMDRVRAAGHTLAHHGLEVSTGPVVPFRAEHELVREPGRLATVPMLWMQHVRASGVTWPLGADFRKAEHIRASAPAKLLVANTTYVVLRRFSAKEEERRLVAAVLGEGQLPGERIGLENHLNFIHRPGGKLAQDEAEGLAALLNSSLYDSYFRISSGNTQVSATELRVLPLPKVAVLVRIAKRVRGLSAQAADEVIDEALRPHR